MFYSKPLRWPRNRNPLRGMWRRRRDQEAAENLTAFQRQEWIGSSLGDRTEKRSEAKTSAPAFSLMAMHFALHSYCIVSPFIYVFCGSYRIQGDYQGLPALPLCFTDDKKNMHIIILSLKKLFYVDELMIRETLAKCPLIWLSAKEGDNMAWNCSGDR